MPFQVINAHNRLIRSHGERFSHIRANYQRACQAGSACNRDAVQVAQFQVCLLKRFIYSRVDGFDVLARGNFRVDPAELSVQVHLTGDDRAENLASVRDHCRCGFIAAGFNT